MKINSYIIVFLFFKVFCMNVFAQNQPISVKKSHQDVKFYFKTIQEVHPNPYAFTSKEKIDSVEKRTLNEIQKPMFPWELSRLIELNTNSLFDNHTKTHAIFYHPEKHAFLLNDCFFFPYKITILLDSKQLFFNHDEKMYKILEINHHPADEVIDNMEKIYSADISQKNKQNDIEIFFPLYYYFIYLEKDSFNIKFEDTLNKVNDMQTNGVNLKIVREQINRKSIIKIDMEYDLVFYTDSIAVLTINTFNRKNQEIYKSFLKNSFQQIAEKNCQYLFIDIKANTGGSSHNVSLLLDYLFEDDYKIFGWISMKRRSEFYIKKYEEKEEKKQNKKQKMVMDYGFFEREEDVVNHFTGTLFLLQSNLTASASLDMSSAIKSSRRGIILGEPTGEPACSYSQGLVFEMPNSKFSFQCATGYFLMPSGSFDDKWIQPDIEIDFTKDTINLATLQKWIDLAEKQYSSFFRNR